MMKSTKLSILLTALILFCIAMPSYAKSLSKSDVEQFISSIDAIKTTQDPALVALKNTSNINPQQEFPLDKQGRISIYRNAIQQNVPAKAKDSLLKLVKGSGFSSIEQWAATSDRVMAAYLNLKLQEDGGSSIPELTPEMRQSMPPEMLALVDNAIKMLDAVQKAPADDVAVVRSNFALLDKALR